MRTRFHQPCPALKVVLLVALLCTIGSVYGQAPLSAVNASAASSNQMIWSVGDIFVLPADPDLNSAGLLGAFSQSGLLTVQLDAPQWRAQLQFYPNPTTGRVYVQLDADEVKEVRLFGGDGRHLATWQLATESIDLSAYPAGMYFLQTDSPLHFATIINKF
jgi:hypothetical protein